MKVTVQKWGNSLALRIPKPFAENVGVREGTIVEVTVVDGRLVAVPIVSPDLNLHVLLSQITEENIHTEIDVGQAVGKEFTA